MTKIVIVEIKLPILLLFGSGLAHPLAGKMETMNLQAKSGQGPPGSRGVPPKSPAG